VSAHGLILAGVTGAVVFLAVELAQAGVIAKHVQREGVTVNAPVLGRVKVSAPSGGGNAVELPPSASEVASSMHSMALGAAALAFVGVLVLAPRK
jgi:hypothetical protein